MIDNALVILAVIFASLLGIVLPWLRRLRRRLGERRRMQVAQEVWHAASRSLQRPTTDEAPVTIVVPENAFVVPESALSVPPRPSTRNRSRWPVENLREARRGIVLITLLGACRGLEPPDGIP
jgi:hypothetical protein